MSQQGRLGTSGGGAIETLTGDSGGPVGPDGADNINIVGGDTTTVSGNPGTNTLTIDASTSGYPITPFVVGIAGQAGYQTIQAGLDAANTAGGGIVYVQPGSYSENLILYNLTQIVTSGFSDAGSGVEITGTHTPPLTGGFVFRNIKLISAGDVFFSNAVGSTHLIVANCAVAITNGFLFNLPNWDSTGIFEMWDVNEGFGVNDGCVNNTGGATVLCFSGGFGQGSSNTMVVSGPIFTNSAEFFCPIDFQNGSILGIENSIFFTNVQVSGNTTGDITNCSFQTDSNPSFTMSSSADISITNCSITSSNNPSIEGSGAGTLTLTGIDFSNDSNIAGTLTLASGNSYSGTYKSDYTDHGVILGQGAVTDMVSTASGTDGQLLIGGTGVDPAFNDLISAGGTITVTPGSNTLNIDVDGTVATTFDVDNGADVSSSANIIELFGLGTFTASGIETHNGTGNNIYFENRRWLSPFVVDPSTTVGERGTFSTIAAAITAASAAGGGLIYIRAGTYVENLTLVNDVHLFGIQTSLNNDVQIDGTLTANFTGVVRIESIFFVNAVGGSNIISSTAGVPQLSFSKCFFVPTTASICGSANASFTLTFDLCGVIPGVIDIFDMSAGQMTFRRGNLNPLFGTIYQNILATGTAEYIFFENEINHFMETQDTATINVTSSNIGSGPNSAFNVNSVGSTIICYNSTINSTDASGDFAIGTGTFNYGDLVLFGTAEDINATLTEVVPDWKPYCTDAATEATVTKGTVGFDSANFSVTAGFVTANASSETVAGVIEISTTAEALAGTSDTTAITPAKLVDKLGVLTSNGLAYGGGTASAVNWLAEATDGQLPIGSTGNPPVLATLTAGNGIAITNAAGSITLDVDSGGMAWTEVTGTTQAMAVDNGYISSNAGLVTLTLPATAAIGNIVKVDGKGVGGWIIAQNAGQTVHFLSQDSTTGAGGSLASTTRYDCVTYRCITTNTDWVVETVVGNLTVV